MLLGAAAWLRPVLLLGAAAVTIRAESSPTSLISVQSLAGVPGWLLSNANGKRVMGTV
jgi:hypothetical protein